MTATMDTKQETTMSNAALVRRVFDEFNHSNLAVFAESASPDFVDHNPPPGASSGSLDGVIAAFRALRDAVPDLQFEPDQIIADGDRVGVRATLRGTHSQPILGIPPTGKPFAMSSLHIFRIADGRIAEHWANQDELGLLQQLGAIPSPG
jgi:steroid delta-isomerase-like uncharacterized protein